MTLRDAITQTRWTDKEKGTVRLRFDFRVTAEAAINEVQGLSSYQDEEELVKDRLLNQIRSLLYGEILEDIQVIHRTLDVHRGPWSYPGHSETAKKLSDLREKLLHILS